jgi:hypothetical protein
VQITSPRPNQLVEPVLPPTFRIHWEGTDPDGQTTQRPVKYKFRLISDTDTEFPLQLAIANPDSMRRFYAPGFAGWDSLSGDSTATTYSNLVPDHHYLFVITAIDEAGDYDPVFTLDKNMLSFVVGYAGTLGPLLTVFNEFFDYRYPVGGFCIEPACEIPVTVPANVRVTFHWSAQAPFGVNVVAYRWALDIADVFDETPRLPGHGDLAHWSAWDIATTSATVGPFFGDTRDHRFYIEAKDEVGRMSLGIVRFHTVRTRFQSDLLIVDDTRFLPDQGHPAAPDSVRAPTGPWPTAAELDTFLFARGGVRWRSYPPGTLSPAGIFAGYGFDTLGTRTASADPTIPLEVLGRYRHVVWIVDGRGATYNRPPTDPLQPMTALRWMTGLGHVNTLAQYVERGGHLWVVGGGAGYASTIEFNDPSNDRKGTAVFSSVGPHPELAPGRFMYEFPHWQTEFRWTTLARAGVRRSPFPIGHGWSRMEYARLPNELALRSPATDPLPPLRDVGSFYNTSLSLEYLAPPGGTAVECGPMPWRWWPRENLDTLMVATGLGLPAEGPEPAHDRIVNPVMTAFSGGAAGSVVFSGFDLWTFSKRGCSRLVDGVLQGMWHLRRESLPAPVESEAITAERTPHSGGGSGRP